MKWLSFGVVCVSAFLIASCRMADGPLPDPKQGELANRVGDLSRDLGNVAAGRPEGPTEFMDDLRAFVELDEKPDAKAPVEELGKQLTAAFTAAKATERSMIPLLEQVVIGLDAKFLSENQVQKLKEDVQKAATDLGVEDVRARALAAQMEIVQQAVTDRHRRWYELF